MFLSSQVNLIHLMLFTIQIVSKQLYIDNRKLIVVDVQQL